MDDRALFIKFWENESKTTRNVIARIPEGSDYRPDPKSRTASRSRGRSRAKRRCSSRRSRPARPSGARSLAASDKGIVRHLREAECGYRPAIEGAARRTLGRHVRVLRRSATGVADGVELSFRHRAPPRADFYLPAPDGIDRSANLRTERGRAITARGM